MATKAKLKIHPMPELGWTDRLIYWTAVAIAYSVSMASVFVPLHLRDKIAFSDEAVIACTVGPGNIHFLWLTLWCLIAFIVILALPYQKRIPILRATDCRPYRGV